MLKLGVVRALSVVLLWLIVMGSTADMQLAKMLLPLAHIFSSVGTALMLAFMVLVCFAPVMRDFYCGRMCALSESRRVRWMLVELAAFVLFCAAGWWWLVAARAAIILMSEHVMRPHETYGVALHG